MVQFFGFEIKRKEKEVKSFTVPENNDGAQTVTAGTGSNEAHFMGQTLYDLGEKSKDDFHLINQYRSLARQPEAAIAIDDIVNEAISYDDTDQMVTLILDDVDLPGISTSIKNKMVEEFNNIYSLLDFQNSGYEIFRRWYIDGRTAYHIVIDGKNTGNGIVELRYIDPRKIRKIREIQKTDEKNDVLNTIIDEYFLYSTDFGKNSASIETLKISKDSVAYATSGLMRNEQVISYIDQAIKPLNQLRIIEDASIIYKVTRAPERRVFYINVGDLPRAVAEKHLNDTMMKYKNKTVYDSTTGTVTNSKKLMTMSEDYWLPRNSDGKGTEIDTVGGGTAFEDTEQMQFFLRKLYRALNVPVSRMDTEATFNVGRSSEITRDEVKFTKFIVRLRNRFSLLFTSILEKQLILKGILTAEDWKAIFIKIKYKYADDSHFSELKDSEVMRARMEDAAAAEEFVGLHLSRGWIDRNIFKLTKEEIAEMAKEIEEEKKSGRIESDDIGADDDFDDSPPPKPAPAPVQKPVAKPEPEPKEKPKDKPKEKKKIDLDGPDN